MPPPRHTHTHHACPLTMSRPTMPPPPPPHTCPLTMSKLSKNLSCCTLCSPRSRSSWASRELMRALLLDSDTRRDVSLQGEGGGGRKGGDQGGLWGDLS